MIYSTKKLLGKRIHAINEDFGTCKDFLFDDQSFHIRYIVVDTGNWLPGRKVLITPQAIESLHKNDLSNGIPVCMSKERIEKSPSLDADKPVSRQVEEKLHVYYGWQPYWFSESTAPLYVGIPPIPTPPAATELQADLDTSGSDDPNLRSLNEVRGYAMRPADESNSGPLHDLLVDSSNWTLKYAVVDTRPWFPGAHKVIPTSSIKYIDYERSEIGCTLTADQIKNAPEEPHDKLPVPFETELELQKHGEI